MVLQLVRITVQIGRLNRFEHCEHEVELCAGGRIGVGDAVGAGAVGARNDEVLDADGVLSGAHELGRDCIGT